MIQQLFNMIWALLVSKVVLNELPHIAQEGIFSDDFLDFVRREVATTKYISQFSGIDVDKLLTGIEESKPEFAVLLNAYFHIATQRATPSEINTAFNIVKREIQRLVHEYEEYKQRLPTGEEFEGLVSRINMTRAYVLGASTRSDRVIAIDMFMGVGHGMIVDRWEGYMLSGEKYPLMFDLTDKEAEFYREFLDVLRVRKGE